MVRQIHLRSAVHPISCRCRTNPPCRRRSVEDNTRGTSTIGRIPRLPPSHTSGAAKLDAQPAALTPEPKIIRRLMTACDQDPCCSRALARLEIVPSSRHPTTSRAADQQLQNRTSGVCGESRTSSRLHLFGRRFFIDLVIAIR
jgi:hypothetical protein